MFHGVDIVSSVSLPEINSITLKKYSGKIVCLKATRQCLNSIYCLEFLENPFVL